MTVNPRKRRSRFRRFVRDILVHTPFFKLVVALVALWLVFSSAVYLAEQRAAEPVITSMTEALYWGVAAFSTAGIADTPEAALAQVLGGLWIVIGSVLFFGAIVATVTAYFMRPMQRPHRRIIDTIEYNLEQIGDLSIEELDLLKGTVDTLIAHVEHHKARRLAVSRTGS